MATDPDTGANPILPVQFHLRENADLEALKKRAAEIDDENNGDHMVDYTLEQALTVVFHGDPEFLFGSTRATKDWGQPWLAGWTVEKFGLWDVRAEWAADVEEDK